MEILSSGQQSRLQALLITHLENAKRRNPQFGLRSLARMIDLSPGALSEIMSGKRRVSRNIAQKVLTKLMIDPQVTSEIFKPDQDSAGTNGPGREAIQLTLDQYQVLSGWQHMAILNLIETKNFTNDSDFMARKLGISAKEVEEAVDRLFRLGMVSLEEGNLKRTHIRYKTTDDVANVSIRKFHFNALHKAEEALMNLPVEERDFSAIILPADPKKLEQIREKIRLFQLDLMKDLEGLDKTEVFQISMQVFPLTKKNEKDYV